MTNFASILVTMIALCVGAYAQNTQTKYEWTNITPAAEFPVGYNYPAYVWGNKMVAFNNGAWTSNDGKSWAKISLPIDATQTGTPSLIQFDGAVYALGVTRGNYQGFSILPNVLRTVDLENWQLMVKNSNFPRRMFNGKVVFRNQIWMFGGYNGQKYFNDVWTSDDAVRWEQVSVSSPWTPRTAQSVIVYNDEIWILGGGVIDGEKSDNPASNTEIWATKDGKAWRKIDAGRELRGTPVVFDGKLWLVGANRGDKFASGVWETTDGKNWTEHTAPWSPRGAVAAWVFGDKLYITGGKSSHVENGETKFVYSNDVWAMSAKKE